MSKPVNGTRAHTKKGRDPKRSHNWKGKLVPLSFSNSHRGLVNLIMKLEAYTRSLSVLYNLISQVPVNLITRRAGILVAVNSLFFLLCFATFSPLDACFNIYYVFSFTEILWDFLPPRCGPLVTFYFISFCFKQPFLLSSTLSISLSHDMGMESFFVLLIKFSLLRTHP